MTERTDLQQQIAALRAASHGHAEAVQQAGIDQDVWRVSAGPAAVSRPYGSPRPLDPRVVAAALHPARASRHLSVAIMTCALAAAQPCSRHSILSVSQPEARPRQLCSYLEDTPPPPPPPMRAAQSKYMGAKVLIAQLSAAKSQLTARVVRHPPAVLAICALPTRPRIRTMQGHPNRTHRDHPPCVDRSSFCPHCVNRRLSSLCCYLMSERADLPLMMRVAYPVSMIGTS